MWKSLQQTVRLFVNFVSQISTLKELLTSGMHQKCHTYFKDITGIDVPQNLLQFLMLRPTEDAFYKHRPSWKDGRKVTAAFWLHVNVLDHQTNVYIKDNHSGFTRQLSNDILFINGESHPTQPEPVCKSNCPLNLLITSFMLPPGDFLNWQWVLYIALNIFWPYVLWTFAFFHSEWKLFKLERPS